MNKKILTVSAVLAAASMGFAIETWKGANSDYRVETGFDDGSDTYGYWYFYDDSKETKDDGPGTSKVTWGTTELGNAYSDDALDPVIDFCGGLCGSITLGGPYKYPFTGIGFNVSGEAQQGENISAWGGVCITYKSTGIAPKIEVAPADEATVTEYNNPMAKLKIAASPVTENAAWDAFKQENGWGKKVELETVLAGVAAVKVKFSGKDGESTEFLISEFGAYGKCGGGASNPIAPVAAASSVKATLSNHVLSFSGIKGSATAEIVNLQGQVVLKGSVSSAMNLSSLDAGVYMVRVAGQSVNFSQKILLK